MDFVFNALLGAAAKRDDAFTLDILAAADSLSWSYNAYWPSTGGYFVDYGDGSGFEKPVGSTGNGTNISHAYASPGSYKVRFKGLGTGLTRLLLQNNANMVGCNFRWSALGESFTNGTQMFSGCGGLAGTLASLPPNLTAGSYMFSSCGSLVVRISTLPVGLTAAAFMFNQCKKAEIDLDAITAAAPSGGWPGVTTMARFLRNGGSDNSPGTVTGSRSAFMALFPNAAEWTYAFDGTNTTA